MTDLLQVLQEFYRDKLAELLRHEAGARLIAPYDFNNAYQYTINRDETHLAWVAKAIVDSGGTPDANVPVPSRSVSGKRADAWRTIVEEDRQSAQSFVERWKPRVETLGHARHRRLLNVILGETLEQKRLFEQALAGRTDLLGKRGKDVGPAIGEVLPTRWVG